jgi:predicted glutamine amidotransferase
MCELLGMSASYEVNLDTTLSLLRPCDGEICPDADGWGVALYDGTAARVFKDAKPASRNFYFPFLSGSGFASHTMLARVRRARPAEAGQKYANTHPFEREVGGRSWVFAHDGKLPGIEEQSLTGFRPIGDTDSEHAFCMLLDTARDYLSDEGEIQNIDVMLSSLARKVAIINQYGEFNFLLSDGDHLFVHAHTQLHILERHDRTNESDQAVFLVATHPFTHDEPWACLLANSLTVFRKGRPIVQHITRGPAAAEAWEGQRVEAEIVELHRHEAEERRAMLRAGRGDGHYESS